jgi:hypothetical protein
MSPAPKRWSDDRYGPPGVSPRARIRLTEETGTLLHSVLVTFMKVETQARQEARDAGEKTTGYNRTIRTTRKLLRECERALEEAGWRSASSSER